MANDTNPRLEADGCTCTCVYHSGDQRNYCGCPIHDTALVIRQIMQRPVSRSAQ